MTNILVCVKRVPATGARITLTEDSQDINTRFLGFTISPHEECAVEEAIRQVEAQGGHSTVLTLGPPEAEEQLREALAMGIDEAVHLETDRSDWDPQATAGAITTAVRARLEAGAAFDLLLFGNESADSGGFQVGLRVANELGFPCITGIKKLVLEESRVIASRESSGGWEIFEVPLPAVVTVKEGINLPRYPSFRGKMAAKKKQVNKLPAQYTAGGLEKIRLVTPPADDSGSEVLGEGPEAAGKVVELLKTIGVLS